jgi:hypothetical protein
VEVAAQLERLNHALALRHVRQQPQLQLAVIRHDERVARRGAERLAHL